MKKVVRAQAGVTLERIVRLTRRRKEISFRLSSRRGTPKRRIADEAEAHRAFAREVAAALQEKVAMAVARQGPLHI